MARFSLLGRTRYVVVVPQDRAAEVLKRAQAIDQQESGMFPFIREFKSLSKAIAKFNRI